MISLLSYLLKSSLCLALFFLTYEVFLKKETFFQLNRIFLVSGLWLSLLIPAFPLASPFRTVAVPAGGDISSLPASSPAGGFEPAVLLGAFYAAGVLFFLVRFGFQLVKLRRVVRTHGIRRLRGVKIVAVDRLFSPFSFFNLIFLDPGSALDADLRRILAHEQVHIRQQHTLDILLMEVVLSLQWFNPFVWPYKKALRETHEYLADAGVIAQGFSPVRYQLHMFEQHVGAPLFEFGNNFKKSQIKRRIMMLSKMKSPAAARLKLLLALPLALGLVLAFAQPRLVAGPAAQDAAATMKDHETQEQTAHLKAEIERLTAMEKALKEKLKTAPSDAEKKDLEMKLKEVASKRHDLMIGVPVKYSPEEFKALAYELQGKEEAVKTELAKTTDEAKKAELKATLEKIRKKEESLKAMFDKAKIAGPSVPSADEFKKMMVELEAKEADVKAKLAKTTDPEEKAGLEDTLKKIAQKRVTLKMEFEKAKSAVAEKGDKIAG